MRERNAACYTKRGETAADLLAVLGAHGARLAWEEHLVFGEVRGRANRLANCDQANAGRAARAALRQAETVRALMADERWAARAGRAAQRRRAAPQASRTSACPSWPPRPDRRSRKSALNHRLRRLEALAGSELRRAARERPGEPSGRARRAGADRSRSQALAPRTERGGSA